MPVKYWTGLRPKLNLTTLSNMADMKDWVVRYYDKRNVLLDSHIIKDRTEHEAENEAMADIPDKCDDWTLTPKE